MKKNLLFIFFFIIFYSVSPAQNFNAGITAGLATTQVDGDHLSGFNKAGIIFGGFVNRKFTERTSAQFEIIFIQKGSRKIPTDQDPYQYLLQLNYFEIPVLIKFQATPKFIFEAGASAAVLIFSQEEVNSFVIPNGVAFNKNDFCLQGGFNYPFTDHLTFNARYGYSMVPIRRFYSSNIYADGAQFNNVLSFALHYQF